MIFWFTEAKHFFPNNFYSPLTIGLHWVNGSPVYVCMQVHIGVWLTTKQSVLLPQEPIQGSLHFWLIQANWLEHSPLLMHSGLQFGGVPINSGKHEQEGESLVILHSAFEPQGDGWQEFLKNLRFIRQLELDKVAITEGISTISYNAVA